LPGNNLSGVLFIVWAMLSLLFVFIFTLLWAWLLVYIIDKFFKLFYKLKIKNKFDLLIFSSAIYVGLFIASTIFIFYTTTVAVELLQQQPQKTSLSLTRSKLTIDRESCNELLDNIYSSEDTIYKFENHRYIEQLSPDFSVLLEYKKGAERLKITAGSYDELNLNQEARKYSAAIAFNMRKKARLFEERVAIKTKTSETKSKIAELLLKMDRVTSQRATEIDRIKQQCNS
jgi:hypothetical protein